ncbi:uncharacterized protein LOC111004493 isoform X2 [Momordica charantia]|uniref:Uncharacterized protein LOC111004493 isoform X2 n=1 Tax=Momordica charantia TaxID=3673 RepID=A0A6J1CMG7_MOMCH|nr:uncharacterized protein LOC111004493 isoform X2 [Momordica charantia]
MDCAMEAMKLWFRKNGSCESPSNSSTRRRFVTSYQCRISRRYLNSSCENSRLASADSTGQKSAKIKTRKMMGRSVEDSMQTLMALVKMQAVATVAAQAPAPAPTLEISVEVPEKGGEKQNYNSKQDVMYKETVVQMLFEV